MKFYCSLLHLSFQVPVTVVEDISPTYHKPTSWLPCGRNKLRTKGLYQTYHNYGIVCNSHVL